MNGHGQAIEIIDGTHDADGAHFTIDWRYGSARAIRCRLTSGADGVVLRFGPTAAVADWPAWLRAVAGFGFEGGEAAIWFDPLHEAAPGSGAVNALGLRGTRARAELAELSGIVADALEERCPEPSSEEAQAIETCTALTLAFVDRLGIAPTPALLPHLFLPSPLPILVDDVNSGSARQHIRLTYRLPRLNGRWTGACSFRLFWSEQAFGMEFRALPGDHLPAPLRSVCVQDDLGPLLRCSIDRAGRGTRIVVNEAASETALRLVRAIARQVSGDLAAAGDPMPLPGFAAPHWRHWLAALPDLLATLPVKPLGAAGN